MCQAGAGGAVRRQRVARGAGVGPRGAGGAAGLPAAAPRRAVPAARAAAR